MDCSHPNSGNKNAAADQDQMTRGGNWPFSAAIAVILTIITSVLLLSYSHISHLVGQSGEGSGLI